MGKKVAFKILKDGSKVESAINELARKKNIFRSNDFAIIQVNNDVVEKIKKRPPPEEFQ